MTSRWKFLVLFILLAILANLVLAYGIPRRSLPSPTTPTPPCPGFPARGLLITYDENLSDILDVSGTRKALMLKWNFSCAGVRPATVSEGGPPRPGWSSVVYNGSVFGVPKRFSAIFPDNVSWFDDTPYAVFVTNGSDFRGPLAWLGAFGGADPRWLIAAAMDGDKR